MSERNDAAKYPRFEDGDPSGEDITTSRMEMSGVEADNDQFEAARRVLRDNLEQDADDEN